MIPGLGRSPGEGKDYPLQYSGLENSIDCIVHGVAKSRTRLSDFHFLGYELYAYPGDSGGKESACNAGDPGSIPRSGRSPGEDSPRERRLSRVFLPGKSQGQRSLVGYSPWGHKELDSTEQLTLSLSWRKTSQVVLVIRICLPMQETQEIRV